MRTSSIETRISLANPTSIISIVPPGPKNSVNTASPCILLRETNRQLCIGLSIGNTTLCIGSRQCWGLHACGGKRQLTESLLSFHLYMDSADGTQVTRFTLSGGKCLNWISHPIIPLSDSQPCCQPLVFIYLRWRYACWAWQTWAWINGFFGKILCCILGKSSEMIITQLSDFLLLMKCWVELQWDKAHWIPKKARRLFRFRGKALAWC